MTNMASVLFGDSTLNARRKYHSQYQSLDHGHDHSYFHNNHDNGDDSESYSSQNTTTQVDRPAKGSLADFFFGFMYEEDDESSSFLFDGEESALYRSSIVEPSTHLWNPLHAALCFAQALTSAAAAVPVSLMPVWSGLNTSTASSSSSSSHQNNVALPTAAAVLGAAIGKFINGPICDLVGARRCSVIYSILLSAALIYLSTAQTMTTVARACFWIEFANSIQWPAVIVTLATHHRNNTTGMYQAGVLVTSLASRLGSLSSILVSAWLLRQGGVSCATTALLGAWMSLVAASVTYLLVSDAPNQRHQPQNPIVVTTMDWPQHAQQQQQQKWNGATASTNRRSRSRHAIVATAKLTVFSYLKLAKSILQTNIVPSLQHILGSPTFWMVALAHTGACMVRTSERVLGTYFWQTSFTLVDVISSDNDNDGKQTRGESYHYVQIHALEQSKAAGLSVFFGIGTVAGLLTAGNAFASQTERRRKWLVWRLYLMAIVACYILAALGLSMVRHWFAWLSPPSSSSSSLDLLTIFQVMAVVGAGFGTAVQYYHIPSLVGASFGVDKGMFCAYVDGVALALASIVWGYWIGTNDATTTTPTTMTNVHSNDDANNASTTASTVMAAAYNENGWAYTWAAVALLLILSSVLMVEFMEHYFCRAARRISGTYETIILA